MKSNLIAGLVLGAALLTTGATAQTDEAREESAYAYCAGGPNGPSYAFNNPNAAATCARRIGSYSQDCRRYVRTGRCVAYNYWSINAVNPGQCQCNPGFGYVGYWY